MISGIILGVGLVLFLSISVVPKVLVTFTKATASEQVSLASSYVLGQKILARADGKDNCIINVFLLDKNGRGVQGKTAELEGMTNIVVINPTTSDAMGKISFEMTSTEAKQYKIKAISGGSELPQTVTVTFR
jgi:hypothetical protein